MNYGYYNSSQYYPQHFNPSYATNVQLPFPTSTLTHPVGQQQTHRDLEPPKCHLLIRQEPEDALVTTSGKEKSRKAIDPPPIVEFLVDEDGDPTKLYINSPNLFCTAHLVDADNRTPHRIVDGKPALIGNLCSSIHRLKDDQNNESGFFIFGDISVRAIGMWRIMFTVFDLQKDNMGGAGFAKTLATICTGPFSVYAGKDYKGMNESTLLTRSFSDQGVRLRLRKEQRPSSKRKAGDVTPEPSEEDTDKRQRYDDFSDQHHTSYAGPVQPPSASLQPTSPSPFSSYMPNSMHTGTNYFNYSTPQTQSEYLPSSMRATANLQAGMGLGSNAVLDTGAVGMGSTDPADYVDHLGAIPTPQSRYQERVEAQQHALISGAHLNGAQRY